MSLRFLEAAAVGGAMFGAAAAVEDAGAAGIARLAICGAALAAAAMFDLIERRIPNRVTIPAALSLLVVWAVTGARPGRIAAGLVVAAVLLALGLIKPDAIGMGDAKLALVVALGLMDKALMGLAWGLVLAAVFAVAPLWPGRSRWKSSVPLGPFLGVGALIAVIA